MLPETLDACLARIRELDDSVRAWVEVAPQPALAAGPLDGLPFGVKDIFETRGMATEYGSPIYRGRQGNADAAAVTRLRRLGAVLVGKTHTTAFASFDPAPTRNPRLAGHTPGGSSAGSAAAVAAGMVPLALGTQTLGSVIRPASYCGVCGFKPTFGRISMEGVLPFAPSLDTVGLFTGSAREMARVWTASFGAPSAIEPRRAAYLRLTAEESMTRAIKDALSQLRAGGLPVDPLDAPDGWNELVRSAREINRYEGARTHEQRYRDFGERIGARLAELVRAGLAMSRDEYDAARRHVTEMRRRLAPLFGEYAIVLTPAATGPAPDGYDSTGDPVHNAPWTAIGAPAVTLPLPVEGAPLGLQLCGAPEDDDALLTAACRCARLMSESRGL
jgi:Asp-tRNA(Asn)/Glu-tRNA(Gln) amidotransferase A subunit family amidase